VTIKVAIVGTGNVARQNYLPCLAAAGDVSLSYFNRTREKAVQAAEQYGGRVAASLQELMAEKPDTVFVLTRESQRYEVACRLLGLGPKRLFFEKPLVAQHGQENVVEEDFARATEILQRAHDAGTETAMVFNYRFFDQSAKAKQIVDSGQLGEPVHFTGLVHYACWSHCIDLLLYFIGPMVEITALGSTQEHPALDAGEATPVCAAVRAANGATGTIIGTAGIDFGLPLYELTLAYEKGRISMRDLDGPMEVIDYRTHRHELHTLSFGVSRWDQYKASFCRSINAYLSSIRESHPPPIPGIAGLRELQFEAALKRSIAQRRPVALDQEFAIDPSLIP
jgi:predicted dehydrogenase